MALYVDGFVIPVPTKNLAAYRRMARLAGKVWRDHGALEYRECVGEDLLAQGATAFPKAARAKRGETIVFSWIVYRSKADQKRVKAKVMEDPRILGMTSCPFDPKRMVYGGFKVIVDA